MIKMLKLICCCCGMYCKGKQWYNRDKGYGICKDCIQSIRDEGKETEQEIKQNYGIEGENFNVK